MFTLRGHPSRGQDPNFRHSFAAKEQSDDDEPVEWLLPSTAAAALLLPQLSEFLVLGVPGLLTFTRTFLKMTTEGMIFPHK